MIIPFKPGTDDVANNCSDHLISSLSFVVLIILLDIVIGLIKDVFILDFVFDPNNAAERFFNLLLTGGGALPAIKTYNFHDTVDVSDDALYNDRCTAVLQAVKKFSECSDTSIDFLIRDNFFFCLCSFFGQLKKKFQKFNTGQKALLVFFSQRLQLFTKLDEFRVLGVIQAVSALTPKA